jgi:hypothetical protein
MNVCLLVSMFATSNSPCFYYKTRIYKKIKESILFFYLRVAQG